MRRIGTMGIALIVLAACRTSLAVPPGVEVTVTGGKAEAYDCSIPKAP